MHHLGLINFMDPLPEHVVNESRRYKHQASSTSCCINRQATVKSQAWTCGCFCFTSKGTQRLHAKNIRELVESHPSLDISHAALPIPAFPGAAIGTLLQCCRRAVLSSWELKDRVLCPHSVLSSSHSKWGRTQLIQPAYASL